MSKCSLSCSGTEAGGFALKTGRKRSQRAVARATVSNTHSFAIVTAKSTGKFMGYSCTHTQKLTMLTFYSWLDCVKTGHVVVLRVTSASQCGKIFSIGLSKKTSSVSAQGTVLHCLKCIQHASRLRYVQYSYALTLKWKGYFSFFK